MVRPRTVIWVPAGSETRRWALVCIQHCTERGYEVVGMVVDDGRPVLWEDVWRMMTRGDADVVVAARQDHMPQARVPRVEYVDRASQPPPQDGRARRRPRIVGHEGLSGASVALPVLAGALLRWRDLVMAFSG